MTNTRQNDEKTRIYGDENFTLENSSCLWFKENMKFMQIDQGDDQLIADLERGLAVNGKFLTQDEGYKHLPSENNLNELLDHDRFFEILDKNSEYLTADESQFIDTQIDSTADIKPSLKITDLTAVYRTLKRAAVRKFFSSNLNLKAEDGIAIYEQLEKKWCQNFYGVLVMLLQSKDESLLAANRLDRVANLVIIDGRVLVEGKIYNIKFYNQLQPRDQESGSYYHLPGEIASLVDPMAAQLVAIHATNSFLPKIIFDSLDSFGALPRRADFKKEKFESLRLKAMEENLINDPALNAGFCEKDNHESVNNPNSIFNTQYVKEQLLKVYEEQKDRKVPAPKEPPTITHIGKSNKNIANKSMENKSMENKSMENKGMENKGMENKSKIAPEKTNSLQPQNIGSEGFFSKFKNFVKAHKTGIIIGAVLLGLIAATGGSLGIAIGVGAISVGALGVLAFLAHALGGAVMAVGGGIAAHIGLAGAAIGIKAAIGAAVPTVGASLLGSIVGGSTSVIKDKIGTARLDTEKANDANGKPNNKANDKANNKANDNNNAEKNNTNVKGNNNSVEENNTNVNTNVEKITEKETTLPVTLTLIPPTSIEKNELAQNSELTPSIKTN